jgi:hypothetical protein
MTGMLLVTAELANIYDNTTFGLELYIQNKKGHES